MLTTKLATAAVTGVLSLAVTGAAAFAAFQPGAATAIVGATDTGAASAAQAEREGPKQGIREVLERLVKNGTITQAQAEAILKALKESAGEDKDRDGAAVLKRVLGDMMKLSAEYLGLGKEELGAQLKAGKSLGEIANATQGKSREGLIAHVAARVTAQIDRAVAEGKITQAQADRAKANLVQTVTRFVDHKREARPKDKDRDKGKDKGKHKDDGKRKHLQAEAFMGDLMKAATAYLGIERGAITSQMAQGKSLGEIAAATAGKSRDGLIQALIAAATAEIDAAVASGKLSKERADEIRSHLTERVGKFVDHKVQKKPLPAERKKPAASPSAKPTT